MNTKDSVEGTPETQINMDTSQFLTFMLNGEEYGVDILRVQGIHGWTRATPIPNTPEHILGVINLRGAIVPIIDLRRHFGLEATSFGPTTVVIIIRVNYQDSDRVVGMVVDGVSDVYRLALDVVQPAPEIGGTLNGKFVQGLATVEDKMLILLDVDNLVNDGLLGDAIEAIPSHAQTH